MTDRGPVDRLIAQVRSTRDEIAQMLRREMVAGGAVDGVQFDGDQLDFVEQGLRDAVDETLNRTSTLFGADALAQGRPQVERLANDDDPEQLLAIQLMAHLNPECCCAVCEALREHMTEVFAVGGFHGPAGAELTCPDCYHAFDQCSHCAKGAEGRPQDAPPDAQCQCGHQRHEHGDHWGPACRRGLPRRMVDPYRPCPCKQFEPAPPGGSPP